MKLLPLLLIIILFAACSKKNNTPASPGTFSLSFTVNGSNNGTLVYQTTTTTPVIRFSFSAPVQTSSLSSNITFLSPANAAVSFSATLQDDDSVLILQPDSALKGFSKYTLLRLLRSSIDQQCHAPEPRQHNDQYRARYNR